LIDNFRRTTLSFHTVFLRNKPESEPVGPTRRKGCKETYRVTLWRWRWFDLVRCNEAGVTLILVPYWWDLEIMSLQELIKEYGL
jgi:hypothetical protein